jgi:hypothetical protein
MKRRHGFIPSALDQLEVRVVLSRTTLGLSTVVSGLSPHLRVLNRQQTALVAEVNQAFDSFQNDYDQARSTFFASLQASAGSTAAVSSATTAFTDYTVQRTQLLAQQIISSFVQTPQGTAKAPSQPYALKTLVESKIIGPKGKGPGGSLIDSLTGTIPQIDASVLESSPTTSLYTLSQDNAIESARTAVLNGVSIMKSGAFGIQKVQQY